MNDENVLHGEEQWYLQVNEAEICEASLDPDNEGVCSEICQLGKVIVCVMTGE